MNFRMCAPAAFRVLVLLCLPVVFGPSVQAQVFSETKIGVGISTLWINGYDEGTLPLAEAGGGFDGQQIGVGLRLRADLGENGDFRIPFGVDYYLFRGRQRIPFRSASLYLNHSLDMPVVFLGLEYEIVDFNKYAQVYVGMEGRAHFILSPLYEWQVRRPDGEVLQELMDESKGNAFRMGAAVRLGVEGEIDSDWYLDASVAYSGINLTGANEARGKLFTPGLFTPGESTVGAILFSLTVMYKM